MSERPVTLINLERYRERLERAATPSAAPSDAVAAPPLPDALMLLGQLGDSISRLPGGRGEGIKPLFEQVRGHVEALFPPPGAASLDEEAEAAHQEKLEELCQTLEGVLYACSVSAP